VRCPFRIEKCTQEMPPLEQAADSPTGHLKACWVDVRIAEKHEVASYG
jgi:hypothetical protein